MKLYSICATCGGVLQVTWLGQETHPSCESTETEKRLRAFVDAVQRGDDGAADELERAINKPQKHHLGKSALWYAKRGWPVFPLRPNDKIPAFPGAHPKGDPLRGKCKGGCGKVGHGLYDATTDPELVKKWWTEMPDANIGIRTGVRFDVIDIDGPEGVRSLAELNDDVLPDLHGKVDTPGGFHLLTLPSGDGNRAGVRPGIDYRGVGGYVCAPPSVIHGKRYTWIVKPSPQIIGSNSPARA